MPTGYTAAIADGITFEQYAMQCARAFGALVMMRDEPSDAPIPEEFAPSSYHDKAIAEERERIAKLNAMSQEQAERAAAVAWDAAETSRLASLQNIRALRAKYDAMLTKVGSWTPPTPDHAELHKFMREQIEQSIDFDCGEKYYSTPTERKNGSVWLAEQLREASRSLAYHMEEAHKERERAASRTAWVCALKQSLIA
jgi:hypothetical protein